MAEIDLEALDRAIAVEEAILTGMNAASKDAELHYAMMSPAWDVTCARLVGLRKARARLREGEGE